MMDLDSEPQDLPADGQNLAPEKQKLEQATAQAKAMWCYAWSYAMLANGQPLALR